MTFDKEMKNTAAKWGSAAKWGCSIPLVIIALLPFIGYPKREFRTSRGIKLLPAEATHVEEDLIHGFIGGDFTRLLKAELPADRFPENANALGLSDQFDPRIHSGIQSILNMKIGDAPAWWNPPEVDSTAYFQHKADDDYLRVLRYHDGSVYFLVSSW